MFFDIYGYDKRSLLGRKIAISGGGKKSRAKQRDHTTFPKGLGILQKHLHFLIKINVMINFDFWKFFVWRPYKGVMDNLLKLS